MPVFRVPATLNWNGPGTPGVNIWSVRTTEASVVVDELDAACGALKTFYDTLTNYLPSGMTVVIGPDIVDRESQEDETRPTITSAASGSGGYAPFAVQACVSWRTTLRARRGMGRTFIGPLATGTMDTNGTPGSAFMNALNIAASDLVEASDSATGWAIGVWGLESPGVYDQQGRLIPGQPHVHRDITSFKIRDQFAVLRSRRD